MSTKRRLKPGSIGIDFGTTFSSICLINNHTKEVEILEDGLMSRHIPSHSCYQQHPDVIVGEEAMHMEDISTTIIDNKRFLGARWDDVKHLVKNFKYEIRRSETGGVEYELKLDGPENLILTPIEVAIDQLKEMKKIILHRCSEFNISTIVITTPIRFTELQRRVTALAGIYIHYYNFYSTTNILSARIIMLFNTI